MWYFWSIEEHQGGQEHRHHQSREGKDPQDSQATVWGLSTEKWFLWMTVWFKKDKRMRCQDFNSIKMRILDLFFLCVNQSFLYWILISQYTFRREVSEWKLVDISPIYLWLEYFRTIKVLRDKLTLMVGGWFCPHFFRWLNISPWKERFVGFKFLDF